VKVIRNKDGNRLVLNLSWFEKYYDYIFFVLLFFLLETYIFVNQLQNVIINPSSGIFIIAMLLLIFFTWSYIFSFRQILEIDFVKNQIIIYKKFFRIRSKEISYLISDIKKVISHLSWTGGNGGVYEINVKTNKEIPERPLIKFRSISKKVSIYYKYYIDLFNILIVRELNQRGYLIKSMLSSDVVEMLPTDLIFKDIRLKLSTDIEEQFILDLINFKNLKNNAKKNSGGKKFSLDFSSCIFFFLIGLFLYGNIILILRFF